MAIFRLSAIVVFIPADPGVAVGCPRRIPPVTDVTHFFPRRGNAGLALYGHRQTLKDNAGAVSHNSEDLFCCESLAQLIEMQFTRRLLDPRSLKGFNAKIMVLFKYNEDLMKHNNILDKVLKIYI